MIEYKAKQVGIVRDPETERWRVTYEIQDGKEPEESDKLLRITAREWKEKRSLDANSYFHLLCGKLAEKLGESTNRVKNHLIASYGQPELLEDDQVAVFTTNIPEEWMMEREYPHTECIMIDILAHPVMFTYRLYRGSHTYDTKEMSRLIEGTISECKAQGIDTMTPEEQERMLKAWEANYGPYIEEHPNG